MTLSDQHRAAPFVGPRPYKIGEKLFGRDRERRQLLALLIAERIVLFYSPSGAGKTSLVQAGLVPALQNEAFTVPGIARVTFERTTGISEPVANRYVFAVLLSLEEGQPKERQLPLTALGHMTLSEYLDQRWAETAKTGGMVLILDQFEEILTIDPSDAQAKKEFFAQLGEALRSPYRWALVSMREEHVAGLDPYRSLIPTRLASTFRLELLNEQQARQAMQETSAQEGVVFTDAAARKLTDDLRRIRVERSGGLLEEQLGPTVEPTQLQVVCLRLWDKLAPNKTSIDESDIEALGSADTALADYYAETVGRLGSRERLVRDWIEDELITPQGLRNQILKEDALQSRRVDAEAIVMLDDRHLVREERRRGIGWLELSHDRLVQPIRANNTAWREAHLTLFQRQAALWESQKRPHHLEFRGQALRLARRWARKHDSELTSFERDFLNACMLSRRARSTRIVSIIAPALVIFAAVSFDSYRRWLAARPWADWVNLSTGESYELGGDFVSIGRPQQGFEGLFRSQINLQERVVSRWHLMVSRDLQAFDMRSLNGTTINARFLPYGYHQNIKDGDLVTIAGIAPFRFSNIKPYYIPLLPRAAPKSSVPTNAWAILIVGPSRTIIPLTEDNYFLRRGQGGNLFLSESRNDASLLSIKRANQDIDLQALRTSDADRLLAMFKYEDRNYVGVVIPRGQRVSDFLRDDSGKKFSGTEYASKMSFCFGPASQGTAITLRGVQTKIVDIQSNDQPSCTLGPFQIVVLR